MRFIKEVAKVIWEATIIFYYESAVVLIYRIKTGKNKFYWEIKEERKKKLPKQ